MIQLVLVIYFLCITEEMQTLIWRSLLVFELYGKNRRIACTNNGMNDFFIYGVIHSIIAVKIRLRDT